MIFNFYVKAKGKGEHGFEMEGVLDTHVKIPRDFITHHGGIKSALLIAKKQFSKEKVIKDFIPNDRIFKDMEILEVEMVYANKGKWINGMYYAHEYECSESKGRARKIKYSNGYIEYEIECLDDSKSVMDGMWDAEDVGSSQIGNGCGDHFEPYERGLFN